MTAGILPLRPYQAQAIKEIRRAWDRGVRRPAVVLPTGAGKTVIFSHLGAQMHAERGVRSLVLVHTTELVEQAVRKFRNVAPHLNVGVVKAERDEHADADIIVATVQTLRVARRREVLRNIGVIVVDECHHASAASYRAVMEHFGCFGDGALAAGFTATLARGDGAALGEIWQKVVYRKDITDMIGAGHLLPIRGKRIKVPDLDFSKARMSRGDYRAEDLGDALTDSLAPGLVAAAYREHAADRSGILFAPTVDSAYVFRDAFRDAGISCETVHGALPREERALILKRLDAGDVQVVSNCMVLTEGFDSPRCSCAVICRPTTSSPLYTQMVGRVLRPYPGQAGALLLDVVGVTGKHRLASLVDLVGDPTKILHKDAPESLADLLLTADGCELEDAGHGGGGTPITFQEADGYEAVDVDLFAKSHSAWLRTAGGTWFLPAGKAVVFLAPAGGAGTWNVAIAGPAQREMRYRRISLDAAMAWGEEVAVEVTGNRALFNRKAQWRRASQEPTAPQVSMARRLRIDPAGRSKAELSDLISTVLASRELDPLVARWTRQT